LRSDTISTVLLVEWQLTADYFDGDALNGPVPRLFAPDPAIAKAAISNDPAKVFKDVQRLHARLFISEHVIADEAWEFVGNPRYPNILSIPVNKILYKALSRKVSHFIYSITLGRGR
jgi:hypothetical protein